VIDRGDPYGEAEGYFASDSPPIKTMEEAERWIQILHRRSVRDAQEMVRLADRIRPLERPWWRRLLRV
jgi:hypothetical protein